MRFCLRYRRRTSKFYSRNAFPDRRQKIAERSACWILIASFRAERPLLGQTQLAGTCRALTLFQDTTRPYYSKITTALLVVEMKRGSLEAKIVMQKGDRLAVMSLSGPIGLSSGLTASYFIESLLKLGKYNVLYAVLDSSGGSPVDAWTIFNFLKKTSDRRSGSLVLITGECSGDAVLIALAFDQILMRPAAYMGFRPAKFRNLEAIRFATSLMSRLIATRAGCQQEDVLAWIDTRKRFTAKECLARSLCDAIV